MFQLLQNIKWFNIFQDFLSLDEIKTTNTKEIQLEVNEMKTLNNDSNNHIEKDTEKPKLKSSALVISGVSASWQEDPIVSTLRNLTLTATPGEFVGIAGLVGSGKVCAYRATVVILHL